MAYTSTQYFTYDPVTVTQYYTYPQQTLVYTSTVGYTYAQATVTITSIVQGTTITKAGACSVSSSILTEPIAIQPTSTLPIVPLPTSTEPVVLLPTATTIQQPLPPASDQPIPIPITSDQPIIISSTVTVPEVSLPTGALTLSGYSVPGTFKTISTRYCRTQCESWLDQYPASERPSRASALAAKTRSEEDWYSRAAPGLKAKAGSPVAPASSDASWDDSMSRVVNGENHKAPSPTPVVDKEPVNAHVDGPNQKPSSKRVPTLSRAKPNPEATDRPAAFHEPRPPAPAPSIPRASPSSKRGRPGLGRNPESTDEPQREPASGMGRAKQKEQEEAAAAAAAAAKARQQPKQPTQLGWGSLFGSPFGSPSSSPPLGQSSSSPWSLGGLLGGIFGGGRGKQNYPPQDRYNGPLIFEDED